VKLKDSNPARARDYLGEFGGWLDDELEWFFDERRFYYTPTFGLDGIPREMPQDDPERESYHGLYESADLIG